MKSIVDRDGYDVMLEPSDWRYSAAICGLANYLDFWNKDYCVGEDYILYKSSDIDEKHYLEFAENYYGEKFHHIALERMLKMEANDDIVKDIKDKMKANTVCKKVFKGIEYDGSSVEKILEVISENRKDLIKETYRSKKDMYANFCNTNCLLNTEGSSCRIVGYNIDMGKKSKSASYNFSNSKYTGYDCIEFDFIPFAFTDGFDSYFINDNTSVEAMILNNEKYRNTLNGRYEEKDSDDKKPSRLPGILEAMVNNVEFIMRDVEVIHKSRENEFFEDLYIRGRALEIIDAIRVCNIPIKTFNTMYKLNDRSYINIGNRVFENILNNVFMDDLILLYFDQQKDERTGFNTNIIDQLINVNVIMKGVIRGMESMENNNEKISKPKINEKLKGAYHCAKLVSEKLEENKLTSYRNKLISCMQFKDYDRVCVILSQLSNYTDIEFKFLPNVFADFEGNKDRVYTFINALYKGNGKEIKDEKMEKDGE